MKTITIDGNSFDNLATFYDEIEEKFTKDFDGKMGRNLNAFNDVMHGGFSVTEYDEPIKIIWISSQKSKQELGDKFNVILEIIREHKHISLELRQTLR